MNEHDVEKYILERDEVTIPQVQAEFLLGYKEAREIFTRLEQSGLIKFKESLTYVICKKDTPTAPSVDDDDNVLFHDGLFDDDDDVIDDKELYLRKKALKLCIQHDAASVSMLQRAFPIGYIKACKLIDWMESEGYITKAKGSKPRRVLIDVDTYKRIYAPPTKEQVDRAVNQVLADLNENKSTPENDGEQGSDNNGSEDNKVYPPSDKKPSWYVDNGTVNSQTKDGERDKKIINVAINLAIAYAEAGRFRHANAVYETIEGEAPASKVYKLGVLFKNGDEWQFAEDVLNPLLDRKSKGKYIGLAAMELGLHYEELADNAANDDDYGNIICKLNLSIALTYYIRAQGCGIGAAQARIDYVNSKFEDD